MTHTLLRSANKVETKWKNTLKNCTAVVYNCTGKKKYLVTDTRLIRVCTRERLLLLIFFVFAFAKNDNKSNFLYAGGA